MANKTLGTRQKMTSRVEPAQKPLKPRNPVALPARQRAAGTNRKSPPDSANCRASLRKDKKD